MILVYVLCEVEQSSTFKQGEKDGISMDMVSKMLFLSVLEFIFILVALAEMHTISLMMTRPHTRSRRACNAFILLFIAVTGIIYLFQSYEMHALWAYLMRSLRRADGDVHLDWIKVFAFHSRAQ